ncbi:FliM/FliN family flagellar motor switch protein [Terasakiella sp. A23]|uniref:FliM/FliN family flagellar motor switch protein n=1 Tax=Terasakiella sp. FCG-A23 TaxID=3080561 RepID=UPI0029549880|nr:FliM/FliN family flagellar motor switch protein [Terasakiella sp. A23]MDV7339209.1 FliM/FliN family flagellar motor switch protein [Terasakiella sp. A23]
MADEEDDDMDIDWGAALAEDDSIELDERQQAALSDIEAEPAPAAGGPTLGDALGLGDDVEAVYDVEVNVRAVLGMSIMPMSQILKLGRGAVVELDRGVGDPIDVFSSDQKIADGEVVVVEDKLAVSIGNIMRSKRSR